MKKLNTKGFTLVELLAVIVILALLMVVGTRAIGTSLNTAKYEAMKTEAKKVHSKTYEEINANSMLGDFDLTADTYSYGTYTAATGVLSGSDGNYTYKLTYGTSGANEGKLTAICITDGKNGYTSAVTSGAGSIVIGGTNNTTLTFGTAWKALTTCS